jgi:hypothetical protein
VERVVVGRQDQHQQRERQTQAAALREFKALLQQLLALLVVQVS